MELIWKPVLFRSWGSESDSECSQFFRVVSLGGKEIGSWKNIRGQDIIVFNHKDN